MGLGGKWRDPLEGSRGRVPFGSCRCLVPLAAASCSELPHGCMHSAAYCSVAAFASRSVGASTVLPLTLSRSQRLGPAVAVRWPPAHRASLLANFQPMKEGSVTTRGAADACSASAISGGRPETTVLCTSSAYRQRQTEQQKVNAVFCFFRGAATCNIPGPDTRWQRAAAHSAGAAAGCGAAAGGPGRPPAASPSSQRARCSSDARGGNELLQLAHAGDDGEVHVLVAHVNLRGRGAGRRCSGAGPGGRAQVGTAQMRQHAKSQQVGVC